jgi:hypothetical protein
MDIEALSLGIEGKFAMWRSLKEIADQDAQLGATDFDSLAERAGGQRETLEPYRLQASAFAFSPDA